MSIQQELEQAVRRHEPVRELRRIAEQQTTSQIARENELSHENAMDVRSIMSALCSLVARVNADPLAKRLAASEEAEDLEQTHLALGRLLRELRS